MEGAASHPLKSPTRSKASPAAVKWSKKPPGPPKSSGRQGRTPERPQPIEHVSHGPSSCGFSLLHQSGGPRGFSGEHPGMQSSASLSHSVATALPSSMLPSCDHHAHARWPLGGEPRVRSVQGRTEGAEGTWAQRAVLRYCAAKSQGRGEQSPCHNHRARGCAAAAARRRHPERKWVSTGDVLCAVVHR